MAQSYTGECNAESKESPAAVLGTVRASLKESANANCASGVVICRAEDGEATLHDCASGAEAAPEEDARSKRESKNENHSPGDELRRTEGEESKSASAEEKLVSRDASSNTAQHDDTVPVLKLKNLTPRTPSPWAFIACVVARNPVCDWKTWQDAGTLLEVYVADSVHGCVAKRDHKNR
jgi:hypothetical protein